MRKEYRIDSDYRPFVSVIVAAYNEESVIAEKIINLRKMDYPQDKIEFLVGSDGSTDRTVEIANNYSHIANLTVLDLPRGGKVNALNALLKVAKGQILVFSDANTMYDSQAIVHLVKYFRDERIGCVSGQLRYKVDANSGQGARSESAYWKYENWVKVLESQIGQLSGANGAIYAIKNNLIREIPKDVINDDFYVSTFALQAGYDVILEKEAIAFENPNDDFFSQFRRHIRDGAGHYQAMFLFWKLLLWRKGSYVYVSHRVIRWLVPFFLVLLFLSNAALMGEKMILDLCLTSQILLYALLYVYYSTLRKYDDEIFMPISNNNILKKIFNITFYFFSVNIALLIGFCRFIGKRQKACWETER